MLGEILMGDSIFNLSLLVMGSLAIGSYTHSFELGAAVFCFSALITKIWINK
jgi:hypothetical protein